MSRIISSTLGPSTNKWQSALFVTNIIPATVTRRWNFHKLLVGPDGTLAGVRVKGVMRLQHRAVFDVISLTVCVELLKQKYACCLAIGLKGALAVVGSSCARLHRLELFIHMGSSKMLHSSYSYG